MNKRELIKAIAEETKFSKSDTDKFFNSMISVISKSLKKGDKVIVPNFISFAKVERKARMGRNPQTGKEIKIDKKNIVKIKASKKLSNAMN